jgi:cysteinyl-tRNA synthetase
LEDGLAHTSVKLVDPAILIREQQQKRELEEQKRVEKERKQREVDEKARQKEDAKKIPPEQLFKQSQHEGKFSQFDSDGIPTHDFEGKEITKSQRKKLEKLWNDHKKKYQPVENGN